MKEITFVSKNEKKWSLFESFLQGKTQLTPDELAGYYTELTDDLSYAKTFYPKSSLVQYLNNLSGKAHQKLYVTKKEDKKRIATFWNEEIPLAIRQSHKELFTALLIFLIAIAIGSISTYMSQDYSRVILGDYYVDMTINNINEDNPMAVYEDDDKGGMFYGLGRHNLTIGLITFALGVISPIFAGFILVSNGLMVGAFQSFFIRYGLFWTSFTTIFIHGALELSAIVIFGGAGLVIGNSWWFPGTYSRMDSFISASKRSIKIVIAAIPVIIVAAFLESYVTHLYKSLGEWGGMAIIIPSFAYIIWYFIILPIRVEKKLLAS